MGKVCTLKRVSSKKPTHYSQGQIRHQVKWRTHLPTQKRDLKMIIENFLVTKRILFLKSSKWHQVFNTKKRSQNSSNLNMQLLYFSKQSSRHGKGCYFVRTKTIICMRYANPIIANLQQARKKTLIKFSYSSYSYHMHIWKYLENLGLVAFMLEKNVFSRWKMLFVWFYKWCCIFEYLSAYFFTALCLRNLKMFLTSSMFVVFFRILHFQLLPLPPLILIPLL